MQIFTGLFIEVLDNGRKFKLVQPLYYYSKQSNIIITIPCEFITDFATTPRFLWSFLPPFGKYAKACVLHDYLCKNAKLEMNSRKYADDIFKEALKASEVNYFVRMALYLGVRIYATIKGLK